jgi:hypothetical protein
MQTHYLGLTEFPNRSLLSFAWGRLAAKTAATYRGEMLQLPLKCGVAATGRSLDCNLQEALPTPTQPDAITAAGSA